MDSARVSEHYSGDAGRRYSEHRQADTSHLGFALNLAFFRPHLRSSDDVLDFGCGNGGMLRLLRQEVRLADGLEVNPTALARARESGCRVFGGLGEVPSGQRYDVIVSNHVLEHVRDVCSVLERLRGLLEPGGLFVTKLPIDDCRDPHQRRWSDDDIDHHLHTWTPRLFANVLRESGFQVRGCRVVTSAWHPRLFPLARLGLGPLCFWAFARLKRRRQLLAVGVNP